MRESRVRGSFMNALMAIAATYRGVGGKLVTAIPATIAALPRMRRKQARQPIRQVSYNIHSKKRANACGEVSLSQIGLQTSCSWRISREQ